MYGIRGTDKALGADEWENGTQLYSCHSVFIDRFIFRLNFPGMRLRWECRDQSQLSYRRHCVTGPEVLSFTKEKIC